MRGILLKIDYFFTYTPSFTGGTIQLINFIKYVMKRAGLQIMDVRVMTRYPFALLLKPILILGIFLVIQRY